MIPRRLALPICLLAAPGCSLLQPSTQELAFYSEPLGAEVIVGSQSVGTTPLTRSFPRGESLTVIIRKGGYRSATRKIDSYPSTTGIVDMITGSVLILPWLGLLSGGAWQLEPSAVSVTLEPAPRPAAE